MKDELQSLRDQNSSLIAAISSLERVIECFGDRFVRPNGNYPFIPFNAAEFIQQIQTVITHSGNESYPFYDFGSGPGTKLVLAKAVGPDVFPFCVGYEIDEKLVTVAEKSFSMNCCVMHKDLLELETGDVPTKPIVAYYYCPIADREKQRKFEKILEDILPVNSYLIANLKQGHEIALDKRFKLIKKNHASESSGIYKKIKDNPV